MSNCPFSALGHDANKAKLWKLAEMDPDHVAASRLGDKTSADNCQMRCKTHDRAKANRWGSCALVPSLGHALYLHAAIVAVVTVLGPFAMGGTPRTIRCDHVREICHSSTLFGWAAWWGVPGKSVESWLESNGWNIERWA